MHLHVESHHTDGAAQHVVGEVGLTELLVGALDPAELAMTLAADPISDPMLAGPARHVSLPPEVSDRDVPLAPVADVPDSTVSTVDDDQPGGVNDGGGPGEPSTEDAPKSEDAPKRSRLAGRRPPKKSS